MRFAIKFMGLIALSSVAHTAPPPITRDVTPFPASEKTNGPEFPVTRRDKNKNRQLWDKKGKKHCLLQRCVWDCAKTALANAHDVEIKSCIDVCDATDPETCTDTDDDEYGWNLEPLVRETKAWFPDWKPTSPKFTKFLEVGPPATARDDTNTEDFAVTQDSANTAVSEKMEEPEIPVTPRAEKKDAWAWNKKGKKHCLLDPCVRDCGKGALLEFENPEVNFCKDYCNPDNSCTDTDDDEYAWNLGPLVKEAKVEHPAWDIPTSKLKDLFIENN
ncbi:hypothetical protein EK21DRAFT_114466 [Setomelanomma holmii]|uniref:Secreted protein n=1 Tax=Setomelanomma holmii TaxID=210430 RepID=A0A9P4H718_9PLEO|nr:hypothetical protein EK21DRAFT_114466 [Setomelanomma holmii]